jgi:hypothetical protein
MDYRMKEFGAVLESRDLAKSLCQSIVDEHWRRPSEHKRLDFAGVRVVSSFFADEFIGGLVNGMGTETFKAGFTLLNLSSINKIWIDRALDKHKGAPARVTPPELPPLPKPVPSKVEGPEPKPEPPPEPVLSKVEGPPKAAPKPAPVRVEAPPPKPAPIRVEAPVPKPEPKKEKPAPKPKPAAKKAAPAKKPAKGKKK